MPLPSRKQREIAARHECFLDIAQQIFVADGYQNLSMDRIAEAAEYSKGTVYQHFSCKEEVLIQLCIRSMRSLLDLFQRAVGFQGRHRERLMAVTTAHDIWSQATPENQEMMHTIHAHGMKERVTPESLAVFKGLEASLIGVVASLVNEAIEDGELQNHPECNPEELVFGLWALTYGGQNLQALNLPLQELGIRNASTAIFHTLSATLDGLQWKPLASELDYSASITRIRDEVFAAETQRPVQ